MESREDVLYEMQQMIINSARAKDHWLSHAAIAPDHVHLAVGCKLEEAPCDVTLAYLNNRAYACGMTEVFHYGYYVGTFSEYDLRVIPRPDERSVSA